MNSKTRSRNSRIQRSQILWKTAENKTRENNERCIFHGDGHCVDIFCRFHFGSRWSTCPLIFFSWLLDHVIYLKLRIELTVCKAEQIHKITTIFTQNEDFFHPGPFRVKTVFILWICSSSINSIFFFSAWDKSRDSTDTWSSLEHM